jgi:hypothetical protein
VVVAAGAALSLVACSGLLQPTPEPTPATAGLLVLAGEPGDATLTAWDAAGAPRTVALPEPATAWISAGPGGRLAATLDDGTIEVSEPIAGRAGAPPVTNPDWRPAIARDAALPEEPLRFATWSSGGTHIAALAADFGASASLTLVVVDPVVGATLLLPLPGEPVVAPLAWVGDDQVLVQTDRGPLVVDISTGDVGAGPPLEAPGGTPVATDPGSLVAIGDPAGGAVDVRRIDAWLAGNSDEADGRVAEEAEVGSIALASGSDRLAVVWQQVDRPGSLAIYRRGDGWAEVSRSTLPGESARAAVDWLP